MNRACELFEQALTSSPQAIGLLSRNGSLSRADVDLSPEAYSSTQILAIDHEDNGIDAVRKYSNGEGSGEFDPIADHVIIRCADHALVAFVENALHRPVGAKDLGCEATYTVTACYVGHMLQ
jgi:hypothetical protein